MRKDDIILCEIFDAIFHPDEYVLNARKRHGVAWVLGILLWTIIGILQAFILLITFIPSKIYEWALGWIGDISR